MTDCRCTNQEARRDRSKLCLQGGGADNTTEMEGEREKGGSSALEVKSTITMMQLEIYENSAKMIREII